MQTPSFVRVSILEPIIAELSLHGDVLPTLLKKYQLTNDLIRDPYAIISFTTYLNFFEEAALLTNDPAFGAKTGINFRPASLGPVGMLFNAMATLRAGFNELAQFLASSQIGTTNMIVEYDDLAFWCYHIDNPTLQPRLQDSEYTLTATMRIIQSSFGMQWRPLEVHIEHENSHNKNFLSRFFSAPIIFGCGINRLVMPRHQIDRHLRQEDRDLIRLLRRHVKDLLPQFNENARLSASVKQLLQNIIGQKDMNLQSVAQYYGMSARSLQRKLAQENTSFSEICQLVRQDLAMTLLRDKNMTRDKIAHYLGYSDASVLWRALKNFDNKNSKSLK